MKLYKELNINSLKDLQKAIDSGKLKELKGFGDKLITHIKEGLIMLKQEGRRFLYSEVEEIAKELTDFLSTNPKVKKAIVAGSFRRKKETIGDLDIVVVCKKKDAKEIINYFCKYIKVKDIISQGFQKATVVLKNNIQVDLRIAQNNFFGATLSYFTGSKAHTLHIRKIAKEMGWKINEYGIFNVNGEQFKTKNEKSFIKF